MVIENENMTTTIQCDGCQNPIKKHVVQTYNSENDRVEHYHENCEHEKNQ